MSWWAVAAASALGLALILLAHTWPGWLPVLLHWLNAVFVGCTLAALGFTIAGVARRSPGGRPLLLALVIALAIAVHDALVATGIVSGGMLYTVAELLVLLAMGGLLVRRYVGLFSDLEAHAARLQESNARLAQVEGELQRAVRARDDFLSIASHELRNPLATLTSEAWMLRAESSGATRERTAMILRQAGHLGRLVEDLLEASVITQRTLTLRTRPLALGELLQEAVDAALPAARQKGLALWLSAPAAPVWVEADATRLVQVFSNLLGNAVKYTAAGGEVHCALALDGGWAQVRVQDTGAGMTPETLSRLFRLFERGDGAGEDGMGVGLALVHHIVEAHGGTVLARSEGLGKGSELELRLPLCEAAAHAPPPPEESVPATSERPGRSVLLIDDNRNLRRSLRMALQFSGFEVDEAENGTDGLQRLLAGGFDAAVVDLRMPGLDGCEVARRVRASAVGERVRLIALTGQAQQDEHARAEQAGFDRVLLKPTSPDDLARLLAR